MATGQGTTAKPTARRTSASDKRRERFQARAVRAAAAVKANYLLSVRGR